MKTLLRWFTLFCLLASVTGCYYRPIHTDPCTGCTYGFWKPIPGGPLDPCCIISGIEAHLCYFARGCCAATACDPCGYNQCLPSGCCDPCGYGPCCGVDPCCGVGPGYGYDGFDGGVPVPPVSNSPQYPAQVPVYQGNACNKCNPAHRTATTTNSVYKPIPPLSAAPANNNQTSSNTQFVPPVVQRTSGQSHSQRQIYGYFKQPQPIRDSSAQQWAPARN